MCSEQCYKVYKLVHIYLVQEGGREGCDQSRFDHHRGLLLYVTSAHAHNWSSMVGNGCDLTVNVLCLAATALLLSRSGL